MVNLYQTLANRENPDYIERNGPVKCNSLTAWLGNGYYFWEHFIDNAHWWGKENHKNNYIICKSSYDRDDNDCLDLIDNYDDLQSLIEFVGYLESIGQYNSSTSMSRVLEYFRKNLEIKAVRANPIGSKQRTFPKHKIIVHPKSCVYIDLMPPVQVCIFDKSIMASPIKVIFPLEYISEILV